MGSTKEHKGGRKLAIPENDEAAKALQEVKQNPWLSDKYDEALEIVNRGATEGLMLYRDLGLLGVEVRDRRDQGETSLKVLAAALNFDFSTMARAVKFIDTFSPDAIADMLEAVNKRGQHISYTHIRLLISVPSEQQRNDLLQLCYDRSWTTRRLEAEIEKRFRAAERSTSTPKPKSPAGGFTRLQSMAKTALSIIQNDLEDILFGQLESLPADLRTLHRIIDSRNEVTELHNVLTAKLEALTTAEEAMAKALETAEDPVTPASAPASPVTGAPRRRRPMEA